MFNRQIGARSVQREFWAVVSQTGLLRKPHPTTQANSGPRFPDGASRGNCVPLWSARTGWAFRLRSIAESPSQNRQTGTYFPDRAPRGNCGPESAPKTGRGFPKDRISHPPLVKIIRFPPLYAEHPRSVPECRHNRNVPSCRQHFTATAKTRAGTVVTCTGLVGTHKGTLRGPHKIWITEQHRYTMPAGSPGGITRGSPRRSAQCRQSADTAK